MKVFMKYVALAIFLLAAGTVAMALLIGGDPDVQQVIEEKQVSEVVETKDDTKQKKRDFEAEVKENQAKAQAELEASRVSYEEFQAVEEGMTFEEVSEITGAYLELLSESGSAQIYMADGVGSLGANANFTFVDGKLYAKAQFGLGGN